MTTKRNKRIRKACLSLFATLLVLAVNACATTSYVGDRYTPTQNVDVFYAAKDVKREYKVIGHLSEEVSGFNGEENAKRQIIAKGKEVGADGVIILGFEYGGTDRDKQYQKAEAIKYVD